MLLLLVVILAAAAGVLGELLEFALWGIVLLTAGAAALGAIAYLWWKRISR